MEIASEMAEQTDIHRRNAAWPGITEVEIDVQFLIHQHENLLAVMDRALVEETNLMSHSRLSLPMCRSQGSLPLIGTRR